MRDPYLILGVPDDADDTAIEAAYLEGIKRCPPERDADGFQALRTAYEALRTQRDRLAYALFETAPPEPADLLDRAFPLGRSGAFDTAWGRPEPALFAALLRGGD
ncbi:molecular chaperone DnaJ [Thiocystis minor]|uniref:J domain-containing protein n=1 Tax=Thiocystis minor TaxID=61597 RepID=UPI0019140736|nr:J domain-containing protein [Thiocystis minor]MBK5966367.1 molecular chaperone DnaJ [Thiocystis minor]